MAITTKARVDSVEVVAQGNERGDLESVPLATTGPDAAGLTEASVNRGSETGTGPADEKNKKDDTVTVSEVMSAGVDDSTEIADQSTEIMSHDVSNFDQYFMGFMLIIQDEIIEADAERSIEEPKNKEMFYKVARDFKAYDDSFLNLTAGDIIKV